MSKTKMIQTTKRILAFFIISLILLSSIPFSALAATNGKTQKQAVSWAQSKYDNKEKVGSGECVALIQAYYEYLGFTPVNGNANTYATNALPSKWKRIAYTEGFVAKPGDIAVWTWNRWAGNIGHVAIVESANATTMTFFDQGKSYGYIVHKGSLSYTDPSWNFWGVIRPDFPSETIAPTKAKISIKTAALSIGEPFEFTFTSDQPCNYTVNIVQADTNKKVITKSFNSSLTKTCNWSDTLYVTGHYIASVTATNEKGSAKSEKVHFYYFNGEPTEVSVSADKTEINLGETITFSLFSNTPYARYQLSMFDEEKLVYTDWSDSATFEYTPTNSGIFSVYASAHTNTGDADSDSIEFEVKNSHIHSLTSKVTKKSTCIAEGTKTFSCSCGYTYSEKIAKSKHTTADKLTKATTSKDGKIESLCSVCGKVFSATPIAKISSVTLSKTSYSYDATEKKPAVTVTDSKGKVLKKDVDYTVSYSANKAIGTGTAKVTFKGNYSGTKSLSFKILPANVSGLKATLTTTSIKLSWSKVNGATGYRIYKYNSETNKYTKLADTTKTSYTFEKLKTGTKYTYYVKAYKTTDKADILSSSYTKIATATKTAAPAISKLTAGSKKVTAQWNKVAGATGYELWYATKKDGTYTKAGSTTNLTLSKTGLKTGTTYYFKVRTYKTVGETKIYSGYSAVKSIKAK